MKLIFVALLLSVQPGKAAELPSWGMTENQYKLPNFNNRMGGIGKQALKNNWQLKVTAPAAWHSTIRNALTNRGERDVQMSLKNSVYQSISITAVPGAKIAQISPSSASNTTVQKQVVIDKPEIDTEIEAPDFGKHAFDNNKEDLLENLAEINLGVPTATVKKGGVSKKPSVQVESTVSEQVEAVVKEQSSIEPEVAVMVTEDVDADKEALRKRYARSKRVEKLLSYNNIKTKDELYVKNSAVLIKRFLNQGVVLFFWMKEAYDPAVHKLIEKGSGKYRKDPEAIQGDTPNVKKVQQKKVIDPTNLNFVAVNDNVEDQDDLRREHIKNKRVKYTIAAKKLKKSDLIYIQNQTILVERKLSQGQAIYYWLVGDTTITREVETKGDNKFVIK